MAELEAWIAEVGLVGDSPTIHIDELSECYRDRREWLGGIEAVLRHSRSLLDSAGRRAAVGVLLSEPVYDRSEELSLGQVIAMATEMPPLLCTYSPGREPWVRVVDESSGIAKSRGVSGGIQVHYCRWPDPDDGGYAEGVWVGLI